MANQARTFEDSEAKRQQVPLLVGLMGPSGGGKTYSALRLATGIQRVTGGDIYVVDTEARRALHYADRFKFRHVPFGAPFGPLDYLAAIEHCAKRGAKIVIVDSMSHEHEGPGGVLEMHAHETKRLADLWKVPEKAAAMAAWQKPKADRRRMINTILQLEMSSIYCFRAKTKLKIAKKKDPEPLGFMPIAGEEFVFEMTTNCLLLPNAGGIPTWDSDETGEQMMIKLPEQFRGVFADPVPLSEDHGEQMAKWAAGGAVGLFPELRALVDNARDMAAIEALIPKLTAAKSSLTTNENRALHAAFVAKRKAVTSAMAQPDVDPDEARAAAIDAGQDG